MTNTDLANALGVGVRTLERYLERGLTRPSEGEVLDGWVTRAKRWRRTNKKPPGPQAKRKKLDALEQQRLIKNKLLEMQLAEKRGELHSSKECEASDARRWAMVMDAIKMAGTRLARRCGNQNPTPETLQIVYDEEVALSIEAMKRGALDELDDT